MPAEAINKKELQDAIEYLKPVLNREDIKLDLHSIEDYSEIKDTFCLYRAMVNDALIIYDQAKDLASITDPGLSGSINRLSEPFQKGHFTMAVIGKMSAGKSTFINAFLRDHNLLPTGHLQTTCTLTTIRHSKDSKLTVTFGDKDNTTKEYQGDFHGILKELVSVGDDYQFLPINSINKLILKGLSEKEILSDSVISELAAASHVSNAQIDRQLVKRYVNEHPACRIPVVVDIECPLPEEYQGWHIVDTPGVDAIGGIEEKTKEFLGGSDEDGNHNVDAIVFIYSAKDNIQEKSLNEFIASTLDVVTEEARKRSFLIINKASDTGFQAHKEEVFSQIENLFINTGKISRDRVFAVDSLDSLLADDSALDYLHSAKKSSPVPDSWSNWSETDWSIPKEALNKARLFLIDDESLEYNNENVRKYLRRSSNFDSLRKTFSQFVKSEKKQAFASIIDNIDKDISLCLSIKGKDLAVLRAGLGQTPEEFQAVFNIEREKLNEFQLRANLKIGELFNTYSEDSVRLRFQKELLDLLQLTASTAMNKLPPYLSSTNSIKSMIGRAFGMNKDGNSEMGFTNLLSWEKMQKKADEIGKRVEAIALSIKTELKDILKEFVNNNQVELNICLPPIDYDFISLEAREATATKWYKEVRVKEKEGRWNKVKRFFAGSKKNWGWETKMEEVKDYNDEAAHEKAIESLLDTLYTQISDFVEDLNVQLEKTTQDIDKRIKDAISSRIKDFEKLKDKLEIAANIKRLEAEEVVLKATVEDLKVFSLNN